MTSEAPNCACLPGNVSTTRQRIEVEESERSRGETTDSQEGSLSNWVSCLELLNTPLCHIAREPVRHAQVTRWPVVPQPISTVNTLAAVPPLVLVARMHSWKWRSRDPKEMSHLKWTCNWLTATFDNHLATDKSESFQTTYLAIANRNGNKHKTVPLILTNSERHQKQCEAIKRGNNSELIKITIYKNRIDYKLQYYVNTGICQDHDFSRRVIWKFCHNK